MPTRPSAVLTYHCPCSTIIALPSPRCPFGNIGRLGGVLVHLARSAIDENADLLRFQGHFETTLNTTRPRGVKLPACPTGPAAGSAHDPAFCVRRGQCLLRRFRRDQLATSTTS